MNQPVLPGLIPMCERNSAHGYRQAHSIAERECPHCKKRDVIYVCEECKVYVEDRVERDRGRWLCRKCGESRPHSQGYRILGRA